MEAIVDGCKHYCTDSISVANRLGRKHRNLIQAIRNMVKKNPELRPHFQEAEYLDAYRRKQPDFLIDDFGENLLNTKYKYNVTSARFEYKMLNEVGDYLKSMGVKYIYQYLVAHHRVDLYIPIPNIVVEFDEDYHKYIAEQDAQRQGEIEKAIGCTFVRIYENDSIGSALAKIQKQITLKGGLA